MFPTPKLCCLIITLLHSFTAHAQTKRARPRLSCNGKSYNQLIIHRIPDYGITGRDGCLVMGEINLELSKIDSLTMEGLVKDAETGHALVGAIISLGKQDGRCDTLGTDFNGRFRVARSSPVKKLQVRSIGYRTLNVKTIPGELF